jgi:MatE
LSQDDSSRVEHLIRDTELEGLEDPEASPSLPAATLVAHAAIGTTAEPAVEAEDTYGEIWRIAWPVVLVQVLVNLVSLIDVAMLGHISSQALPAVGYATQFFFLVQSVLLAIGFACVALMARAKPHVSARSDPPFIFLALQAFGSRSALHPLPEIRPRNFTDLQATPPPNGSHFL